MKKTLTNLLSKVFTAAFALSIGVCSVIGGTAASADDLHTHEFSDVWAGDGKNHWHAAACSHNIVRDMAAHTFENGKCTVCGMDEPDTVSVHKHEYNTAVWVSDSVNHWHAATCGHDIIKDVAAHSFKDGKCTVCGEPEPSSAVTEHKHTFSIEWSFDELNHWYASDCGHDIVKGMAAHTMEGGECTVCGYVDENSKPSEEITAYGGYNESLYCEWTASGVSGVKAYYQIAGGSWTEIDGELIRMKDAATARVDAVGLKAGQYNIKITGGDTELSAKGITVTAYDRSGYAHFGATEGVGAYNDDGTPKPGAQIIYVTEENKNTVELKIGSTTYKGIVNILSKASNIDTPLIVRVIGRVAAATWKEGNVTYTKTSDNTDEDGNLLESAIVGKNGKKLPTSSSELTQEKLIAGGYNELDTSKYSELEGLTSKASYSSGAYDSVWNNCAVSGAENVTVEGIGTDAEIFQWGFTWSNGNSIEVRNLTFTDYTEDACSFEGNTNQTSASAFAYKNFWVHHNTFNRGVNYWDVTDEQDKHDGDGSVDLKRLANVTLSYNHFYDTHKTGLVGADDASCTANVTFHHNYYEACQARLPLARVANMHMYNNYYKGLGNTGTGLSIRAGGYAFVEYCYFDSQHTPVAAVLGTKELSGKKRQGFIKLYNCTFVNSSYSSSSYIKVATDRTARYANDNIYNQYFDTDETAFYYDAVNKRSDVTNLITDTEKVKTEIPKLAGVNR